MPRTNAADKPRGKRKSVLGAAYGMRGLASALLTGRLDEGCGGDSGRASAEFSRWRCERGWWSLGRLISLAFACFGSRLIFLLNNDREFVGLEDVIGVYQGCHIPTDAISAWTPDASAYQREDETAEGGEGETASSAH